MPRSYREEQQKWGLTTALQTLLMMRKECYTIDDIMCVAKIYDVNEALLYRLSYVPNDLREYDYE